MATHYKQHIKGITRGLLKNGAVGNHHRARNAFYIGQNASDYYEKRQNTAAALHLPEKEFNATLRAEPFRELTEAAYDVALNGQKCLEDNTTALESLALIANKDYQAAYARTHDENPEVAREAMREARALADASDKRVYETMQTYIRTGKAEIDNIIDLNALDDETAIKMGEALYERQKKQPPHKPEVMFAELEENIHGELNPAQSLRPGQAMDSAYFNERTRHIHTGLTKLESVSPSEYGHDADEINRIEKTAYIFNHGASERTNDYMDPPREGYTAETYSPDKLPRTLRSEQERLHDPSLQENELELEHEKNRSHDLSLA